MKKSIITLSLIMLAASVVFSQDQSSTCRQQMRVLSFFAGKWKGEAKSVQQGGITIEIIQEENIEFRLDSLVLQLEGVGKRKTEPGKISFHALGFISYNAMKKNFEMKSFLMDGRQTDAFFKVVDKNKYDWGFDVPTGKIVYHIKIDPALRTWNEVGEFSADGKAWWPFFEMNLKKE